MNHSTDANQAGFSSLSRPSTKCCGLTNVMDVQSVSALGFDYAGFIRVINTPRYVSREFLREASLFTEGGSTQMVAVYSHAEPETILTDIEHTPGLTAVQLHGGESLPYIQQLKEQLPPHIALWKVFDVLNPPDEATLQAMAPYVETLLLDLPKGFKEAFDWAFTPAEPLQQCMARARALNLSVILAGKLVPATVPVVVKRFKPDGLDVASGVESSPGQKDYARLQAFVHQTL